VSLGDRFAIEGIVAPEAGPDAGALDRALAEWDASADGSGTHYRDTAGGAPWLVLVRERARQPERWWLHALLLVVTIVTTTIGGAAIAGHAMEWTRLTLASARAGLAFSLPLAAILLAHESGHYVTARRYRVNTSPPFFIPFPPELNLLGTMGAFIRIRSPIIDRRTLFDVGVAGPLAGMAVALPVLVAGLALSTVAPLHAAPLAHQFIAVDGTPYYLGDSLLTLACRALLGLSGTLLLHPLAMAGWVGLLVTSLNLLPLAQFDGGHITHAMAPRAQRIASVFVWLALLALGALWQGWWLWAAVALAVGRGRLAHPPVLWPARELDEPRIAVGWLAIAIFVLTFAPVPIAG
jgi:membrane-associated protease RseP (regulator of RpoE activity)